MYLNPLSFGYESMAEVGILTGLKDQKKVRDSLEVNSGGKKLLLVPVALGKYDVYYILFAKKLSELAEIVRRIDVKPYVKNLDVLIYADLWNSPWHPENMLISPSENDKTILTTNRSGSQFEEATLDDVDRTIVEELMENSRVAFKDIAEKLKISTANVIKRYHVLREKNILNLSTVSLDFCKLGYKAIGDCYIRVENRGTLLETRRELLLIPNSIFCAEFVGGAYDLRVAIVISDLQDFFQLKNRVYAIDNIKNAEFYLNEMAEPWPFDFMGRTIIGKAYTPYADSKELKTKRA